MKRLSWIITIPFAVVAIVFAVNNADGTVVNLWPFPAYEIRVFWIAFAGILLGFLAGASASWLSQGKWRRLARQEARDIASLRRDLAERELESAKRPPTPAPTAPQTSAGQTVAPYRKPRAEQARAS